MSRRACPGGGKVRYRDKKQALRAMRAIRARSGREKLPCRIYHCVACNGYHLTSKAF